MTYSRNSRRSTARPRQKLDTQLDAVRGLIADTTGGVAAGSSVAHRAVVGAADGVGISTSYSWARRSRASASVTSRLGHGVAERGLTGEECEAEHGRAPGGGCPARFGDGRFGRLSTVGGMTRSAPHSADRALLLLAASHGLSLTASKLERWRQAGLVPRPTPVWTAQGKSIWQYPPGTEELVACLAFCDSQWPRVGAEDLGLLAFFHGVAVPAPSVKRFLAKAYFPSRTSHRAEEKRHHDRVEQGWQTLATPEYNWAEARAQTDTERDKTATQQMRNNSGVGPTWLTRHGMTSINASAVFSSASTDRDCPSKTLSTCLTCERPCRSTAHQSGPGRRGCWPRIVTLSRWRSGA